MKDPCHIYHPLLETYVDLSMLSSSKNGRKPFVVNGIDSMIPEQNNGNLEYWIDACKSTTVRDQCRGSICMKDKEQNKVFSLGTIKNGIYDFDHDELIVHYTNGDRCEKHGGHTNYSTEIHFQCDQKLKDEIGSPDIFVELPCHPVFTWRTGAVCEKMTSKLSTSHGTVWVILLLFVVIVLAIAFLWKPHRRERLRQATSNVIQRLYRSNSRTDETNLLVTSNITVPTFDEPSNNAMSFGRLSDEDDDELIIA